MAQSTSRIQVLCGNYEGMTDEGKNQLLTIGEKYLGRTHMPEKPLSKPPQKRINPPASLEERGRVCAAAR
jgi:hypothetical protein